MWPFLTFLRETRRSSTHFTFLVLPSSSLMIISRGVSMTFWSAPVIMAVNFLSASLSSPVSPEHAPLHNADQHDHGVRDADAGRGLARS
jgi:hypothetical protein